VARSKREILLRAYRLHLRHEDLEDCLSQATLELIARAPMERFASAEHAGNILEQRFVSRSQDCRRALRGRSPMRAAMEGALRFDTLEEGREIVDPRSGVEELVLLRLELARLERLAHELSFDQRLVIATQVALQMGRAEFCERHGWSHEKYRKVAQRARARLRRLCEADEAESPDPESLVPLLEGLSERETGIDL
jgi:DNA-directed RNA polymerase specialized sigma24 family protein